MKKVEEKTVEVKRKIHKFYCDRCGEYLGEIRTIPLCLSLA